MCRINWLFLFLIINFLTIDSFGKGIWEDNFDDGITFVGKSEVIINEVLFDSYPGGTDFVELFNNSDRLIRVDQLMLASKDEHGELKQVVLVSNEEKYLEPGEYLVVCEDSVNVLVFYQTTCKDCFFEVEQFPDYPNSSGNVVLLNSDREIVDEMIYSSSMHHPLLVDEEGVSMERVSPMQSGLDKLNWASASSRVGFATPGYQNSMTGNVVEMRDEIFIEPKVISPNSDGRNDFLSIYYNFEKPTYVANLRILDSHGTLISNVVQNEPAGQHGEWIWLGTREDGSKADLGVYVILIELLDQSGEIKEFKKSCSISDRL